jgi:hypothetical protein
MKIKIKLNWGTGIIIASAIFMLFTIITGVALMNQKVDLVSDNYYEKELNYQSHIDREKHAGLLNDNVEITQTGSKVTIALNDSSSASNAAGEIKFYRPSDSSKDFSAKLALNKKGKQDIDVSNRERGYWKVQVNWSANNVQYYFEKPLLID